MTAVWATFVREIRAYFLSPLAYLVLFFFLLVNGILFALVVSHLNNPTQPAGQPLDIFFAGLFFWIFLIFLTPVLTMRLLAEERSTGSIEVLMTAPVTETQVVLGKYLGALVFYVFLWLPTVLYCVLVHVHAPLDWSTVAAGYLGIFGIGALMLALGVFASSLTDNPLIAAVLAFALNIPLVFGPLLLEGLVNAPWLQDALAYVNLYDHQLDFSRGILDTRRAVYYLSSVVFFLFLSARALEGNKWR